jgi:hypothetical protein
LDSRPYGVDQQARCQRHGVNATERPGRPQGGLRTNGPAKRLCSRPTHQGKTEMPQELDEVEGPDELIEGDLDELADDDDLIAEDGLAIADDDDVEDVAVELDEDVAVVPEVAAKTATKPGTTGEESEDEEEEEPDDEDVEASLDTILKERLVVEEPEDDEDTPEPEDRTGDGVERVLPKQPGEFVCRSCFLVKHPNQLADRKKMLCRDCV